MDERKSPRQGEPATGCVTSRSRQPQSIINLPDAHRTPRRKTKIYRVLTALAEGGNYNRFEASCLLSDWCLHSTISEIQRDYDIEVYREFETVPGFQGVPTRCCRYRLLPDQQIKAQKVLANG